MAQPTIKEITATNIITAEGNTRSIVFGLGTDNLIYSWQWATGSWKLEAKNDQGGAF